MKYIYQYCFAYKDGCKHGIVETNQLVVSQELYNKVVDFVLNQAGDDKEVLSFTLNFLHEVEG